MFCSYGRSIGLPEAPQSDLKQWGVSCIVGGGCLEPHWAKTNPVTAPGKEPLCAEARVREAERYRHLVYHQGGVREGECRGLREESGGFLP